MPATVTHLTRSFCQCTLSNIYSFYFEIMAQFWPWLTQLHALYAFMRWSRVALGHVRYLAFHLKWEVNTNQSKTVDLVIYYYCVFVTSYSK